MNMPRIEDEEAYCIVVYVRKNNDRSGNYTWADVSASYFPPGQLDHAEALVRYTHKELTKSLGVEGFTFLVALRVLSNKTKRIITEIEPKRMLGPKPFDFRDLPTPGGRNSFINRKR